MDLGDKLYDYINSKYIYCNSGCHYEDSSGFCKIMTNESRRSNPKMLSPADAKCYKKTWISWYPPRNIVPDILFREAIGRKYGFK